MELDPGHIIAALLTRAYLGHRAAGRGYLSSSSSQEYFAGVQIFCTRRSQLCGVDQAPAGGCSCSGATHSCSFTQLSSHHTSPSACPRPELWASTCLAQSVLSGDWREKCHHMCLQSSLAGWWWWWWCTPSRAHHATDTGRGAVAAAQPAPAAADRLPQRDSAAHRRVDRLLPQLQRAGPGSRVTLATLPSVAQLRRHSVSINLWRL